MGVLGGRVVGTACLSAECNSDRLCVFVNGNNLSTDNVSIEQFDRSGNTQGTFLPASIEAVEDSDGTTIGWEGCFDIQGQAEEAVPVINSVTGVDLSSLTIVAGGASREDALNSGAFAGRGSGGCNHSPIYWQSSFAGSRHSSFPSEQWRRVFFGQRI